MDGIKPNLRLIYALTALLAIGCAGASYILQQNFSYKEAALAEQRQREELYKTQKKIYDDLVDKLLTQLAEKAQDYKQQRKILREVIKPDNFTSPENAERVYAFFKKELVPELRKKATAVIDVFAENKEIIHKQIQDDTGEVREEFKTSWKSIENTQLKAYVDFFEKEEMLLQTYDDLVTFYYTRVKMFVVNPKTGRTTFKRKEDALLEVELISKINTLNQKQ